MKSSCPYCGQTNTHAHNATEVRCRNCGQEYKTGNNQLIMG